MSTAPLPPIAQVLGLTGSALLSGLIGAMSYVSIPSFAELPPALAAKVWKRTYDIGKAAAPPLAITCSLCFGVLASQAPGAPGKLLGLSMDPTNSRTLYAAAALLIPSIVPYTITTMVPVNDKLMLKAKDGVKAAVSDAETMKLLEQWGKLNYGRAVMVLAGSLLGCLATLAGR